MIRSSAAGGSAASWILGAFLCAPRGGDVANVSFACSAFGVTAEEALAEVEKAKVAWLTAARDAGKTIPEPRYRPAIYSR